MMSLATSPSSNPLANSQDEIKENPNLVNLLETTLIDKSGHSQQHQRKTPKHSTARRAGNVYLEKDGSSLFEKESSSSVNVFETNIVLPSKSIPSKARTTVHKNQFVRKQEKIMVVDDESQEATEEDSENNLEDYYFKEPKKTNFGELFKSTSNNKQKSNSFSTSNFILSSDELIASIESVLSQENLPEKKDIESLKQQIQQKCLEIEDEQKMQRLLELADLLNAFSQ